MVTSGTWGTNSVNPSGYDWGNEFTDESSGDYTALTTGNLSGGIGPGLDSDVPVFDMEGDTRSGNTAYIAVDEAGSSPTVYLLECYEAEYGADMDSLGLFRERVLYSTRETAEATARQSGLYLDRVLYSTRDNSLVDMSTSGLIYSRLLGINGAIYEETTNQAELLVSRVFGLNRDDYSASVRITDISIVGILELDTLPADFDVSASQVSININRVLNSQGIAFSATAENTETETGRFLRVLPVEIILDINTARITYSGEVILSPPDVVTASGEITRGYVIDGALSTLSLINGEITRRIIIKGELS
jgi:hypothetical protein